MEQSIVDINQIIFSKGHRITSLHFQLKYNTEAETETDLIAMLL